MVIYPNWPTPLEGLNERLAQKYKAGADASVEADFAAIDAGDRMKEKAMRCMRARSGHAEMVIGLVMVGVGGALLLDRLNLIDNVLPYWPVALIGLGIAQLFGYGHNRAERR